MAVELTIDQRQLQALARALQKEEDGKKLRRQLARDLRAAVEPALGEIRSGLMAMPAAGVLPTEGGPLRTEVLKHLKASAQLSGRKTGVQVRIRKRGPRGFAMAARRLNRDKGWRHPVYGREVWVRQLGKPGYFDDPLRQRRGEYRDAVRRVMRETAARIARNAR